MRIKLSLALALLVILASRAASAEVDDDDVHYAAIASELAVVFVIPTVYYWQTKEHQAVDWTLDWDWDSWEAKLGSFEKLKFDTNPFHVNALRHPLVGVLDYQIGRSNGLSAMQSMWLAYVTGVAWEYFIEYREAPSINDMVENGAAGIAIGEPLYRIGQLWRGPSPSVTDRVHTALASPWDFVHDLYRRHPQRRPAWRSIVVDAGSGARWYDDTLRNELTLSVDFDIVAHAPFLAHGPQAGPIASGAWSRLRAEVAVGDRDALSHTMLHTRTTLVGSYQYAGGTGYLAAIGTAFTYRFDRFAHDRDRLGIMHVLGPQLQLSLRGTDRALWIDVAGYGDFALVDPVAPLDPFPAPPPFFSSLQGDGYYYGIGFTAIGRVRAAYGPWLADVEVAGHEVWQIESHILHNTDRITGDTKVTELGLADTRVFGRGKLAYRPGRLGIAATIDGAYRRCELDGDAYDFTELGGGLVVELDY